MATSRYRKDGEGWTEETDWHQVKVFGREAEYCQKNMRKGALVSVEGSVVQDRWTRPDGAKHVASRILADRVALLHGYCDDAPVSDEFIAAWRAALVLSDMSALATRPETRPQALERLRALLMTLA